jgi:hypothetical protein
LARHAADFLEIPEISAINCRTWQAPAQPQHLRAITLTAT